MIRIYLAIPYSHKDPHIREYRFNIANQIAAALMKKGYAVYSPISHTHPIAVSGELGLGWDYWKEYDETFIRDWADQLWVACIDGYDTSIGVCAESDLATDMGKTVRHLNEYELKELLK